MQATLSQQGIGYQVSATCTSDTNATTDWADVTNLSVTIICSGKNPILLQTKSVASTGGSLVALVAGCFFRFYKDGATELGGGWLYPGYERFPGNLMTLDETPTAGSHTYKLQFKAAAGGTAGVYQTILVAIEI